MEKETNEEDKDTTTEGIEENKEQDDFDLGLSLEEMLQKAKAKSPVLEQISPSKQPPPKSPSPTPSTPPSTGTTPPPPEKTPHKADVIQKESTKEPPPTLDQPKEKTPPFLEETPFVSANISFESGEMQDLNVSPIIEETTNDAETTSEITGASAPAKDPVQLRPSFLVTSMKHSM